MTGEPQHNADTPALPSQPAGTALHQRQFDGIPVGAGGEAGYRKTALRLMRMAFALLDRIEERVPAALLQQAVEALALPTYVVVNPNDISETGEVAG